MARRHRLIVERDQAANYLLVSVVSFAATVILVRLFLELTGYPQVGNGTLHVAHLLWGGLLLFVAVLMVLIWDNPGALTLAAILGGIGIGLFIDEVGKFITQSNDYFFPAAAPIIYGFFLLTVLLYLYVRRPDEDDPRRAMVLALEDLQDAIYGELTVREVKKLEEDLTTARKSERIEIARMATVLHEFVQQGNVPFKDYDTSLSVRLTEKAKAWGRRLGRKRHRLLILASLFISVISAALALGVLVWLFVDPNAQTGMLFNEIQSLGEDLGLQITQIVLEAAVGLIAFLAFIYFLRGNEARGLILALIAVVLSLTAVQLITFYLDQFTAVIPTLFQFGILLLLLSYRRMYLSPRLKLESGAPVASSEAAGTMADPP